jgi:hypothetical protein
MHELQQQNRWHFGQAKGSPFTVPPLVDQLGFCGDGTSSEDILNGDYDTAGLNEHTALLVKLLKQSSAMSALDIRSTITEKEHTGKLRVWKESTSTSPSGMHLAFGSLQVSGRATQVIRHRNRQPGIEGKEEHMGSYAAVAA